MWLERGESVKNIGVLAASEETRVLRVLHRGNSIAISGLTRGFRADRSAVEHSLLTLSRLKGVGGIRNKTAILKRRFLRGRRSFGGGSLVGVGRGRTVTGCTTSRVGSSSFIFVSTNAAAFLVAGCVASSGTAFMAGKVTRTGRLATGNYGIFIVNNRLGDAARTVVNLMTTSGLRGCGFSGTFVKAGKIDRGRNFAAPSARRTVLGTITVRQDFMACILYSRAGFKGISTMSFSPITTTYVIYSGYSSRRLGSGAMIGRMATW